LSNEKKSFPGNKALAAAVKPRAYGKIMRDNWHTQTRQFHRRPAIKLELDVCCQKLIEKFCARRLLRIPLLGEGDSGSVDAAFRLGRWVRWTARWSVQDAARRRFNRAGA